MSLFSRVLVSAGLSLPRPQRQGEGICANIDTTVIAADANATLTVAQISMGAVQFTGFTAGRNITTPTAAAILAAAPDMDIGDSFAIIVSITTAFAGTYVAGAGVTLAGRATTPASSWSIVVVKRLSATTVEWRVL